MPAGGNPRHFSDINMDPDDLFASKAQTEQIPAQVTSTASNSRKNTSQNPRDPPIDATVDREEAREAALRQELAGIRSINEVIEGVVESLERAKGNMEVSGIATEPESYFAYRSYGLDCFTHGNECLNVAEHLDAHSLSNRTQSTANTQSYLAWRKSRHF